MNGGLATGLGRAVADGAITVAFQPIIELATGRVHGFEALARWTDPVLGEVSPEVFISLAEDILSAMLSLIAIFAPLIALFVLVILAWVITVILRRRDAEGSVA